MRKILLTLFLALAVLAAACGSDDGDTATETETTGEAESDSGETESESASGGDEAVDCSTPPLVTEGTLTVATGEPAFLPWVADDNPEGGEGFEAALVYALAEEMGIETVAWTRTGFDDAIAPGAKDYDFNIQQYSITDARDEVVDFSDGYYQVEQAIIGAADSPAGAATSVEELKDVRLGAANGTTSLDYVEEVVQPSTDVAVFDDNVAAKSAFDAGQIDAIVFDLPTAYYITAVEIPEATILGVLPREGEPDELGMLFEDGSPLVACVNEALAVLRDNGTIESLEDEWLNSGGSIPTLEG